MSRFEVAEPSLEALFIEHVGRPSGRRHRDGRPGASAARSLPAGGVGLMARRDPLLPNAGIVARREYRDRVRGPLFVASTIVLMVLAMLVAVAPIAIRYLDRQTVTRIAVVSSDAELAHARRRRRRQPPQHPAGRASIAATWKKPYAIEAHDGRRRPTALADGSLGGVMLVERLRDGQVDVVLRTNEGRNSSRSQLLSVAAFGIGVLDWSARLPADAAGRRSRRRPSRRVASTPRPTAGRRARRAAGRQPRVPRDRVRRPAVHHAS